MEINGRKYWFKLDEELGWFIAAAVIPVVAQTLFTFDPSTITDWQVWAISLGAAVVRALGGAVIAWWTKRGTNRTGALTS